MAFIKKQWLNRVSEYPTQRTLQRQDGSAEVVTVIRNEGEILQEGDAFSAENMNGLELRIENAFVEAAPVVLTEAEYEALSDDEKNNGKIYFTY